MVISFNEKLEKLQEDMINRDDIRHKELVQIKEELTEKITTKEKMFNAQLDMVMGEMRNYQEQAEKNADDRLKQLLDAIQISAPKAPSVSESKIHRHGVNF